MAQMYFNQFGDLLDGTVGQRLEDPEQVPRPYRFYADQLADGEMMYAVLTGGGMPPHLAPWIYDETAYDEFYGRYFSGMYKSISFYAVPLEDAEVIMEIAAGTLPGSLDPRIRRGVFIVVTEGSYYTVVCDKKVSGLVQFSGGSNRFPDTMGFIRDPGGDAVIRTGIQMNLVSQKRPDSWRLSSPVIAIFRAGGFSTAEIEALVAEIRKDA